MFSTIHNALSGASDTANMAANSKSAELEGDALTNLSIDNMRNSMRNNQRLDLATGLGQLSNAAWNDVKTVMNPN